MSRKLCDSIVVVVRRLLLMLRPTGLCLRVHNTGRWKVLLLWLLQSLNTPCFEYLSHEPHPLGWSSGEVVLD